VLGDIRDRTGLRSAAEVGFEFRRRFWNSVTALLRLQEHLSGDMAFRCLSRLVFVDNASSRRVFEGARGGCLSG